MKKLYHAFPRPPSGRPDALTASGTINGGLQVLSLILSHGLLCMPERFSLFSDPSSEREEKRALLSANCPQDEIYQSRACFSLLDLPELSQQIELRPSEVGPRKPTVIFSHADLFGQFAIGLDPLEARNIGVLPAVYYYRAKSAELRESLSSQIVYRLDEIRTVLKILSFIEARANLKDLTVPNYERLTEIGMVPKYEKDVFQRLTDLSTRDARMIFELFNTDRVAGWNLVDFLTMLLSLYQNADSTIDSEPLAFFHQREWRLIHHMREGLGWFSLGQNEYYADSNASRFRRSKVAIRSFLKTRMGTLDENKMRRFWVLAEVEGRPFRDLVREIVVPEECEHEARLLVARHTFLSEPIVSTLPRSWRLDLSTREAHHSADGANERKS
ncbi:hypothetical protein [Bradyrhizobium sp. 174]|uniref:hypothetical protein n=1 Tax=Bradyrhizobium sp. 174 TaxID=2782645 RepID=UPI001FFAE080|nr:hypothetical protein [Bradyrhizobium sp. 174]MCK1574070.1 hypothetical protein [Bradyrhizobium sp. 174]